MPTFLITGASGQLGSRVLHHVVAHAPSDARIVATTRSPDKLQAPEGVEVRQADYDRPATLASAFEGVDYALLISTDALVEPGQRFAQHRAAIEAFGAAGVRHVVYTSLPGAGVSSALMAQDHAGTEDALARSAMGYTVLRNNLYMENLLMALPTALATGALAHARGSGAIAWVRREDCARAAAHALLRLGTGNEAARHTWEVSGPKAWDTDALAAAVAKATGRPLTTASISAAALAEGMQSHGLPSLLAEALASLDTLAAEGHLQGVTETVATLSGSAPGHLEDFLEEQAGALS